MQGCTDLSPTRNLVSFQLHPRPRDRTPRIVSRVDSNARATPGTQSPCLSEAAALGASTPPSTSLRTLDSVRPTITPLVVSRQLSLLVHGQLSLADTSTMRAKAARAEASRGNLSNSSVASGFGSNTGNAFGSGSNTNSMFGGNATSTLGSGGT